MPSTISSVDPDGLLEYSVVYTDRALNHMSLRFQDVMRDISQTLKEVYNAEAVAVIPGSGTFGMEAVARQFATNRTCLVLRNGWFSYRWSQIFEMGKIPSREIILKAQPMEAGPQPSFAPIPLDDAINTAGGGGRGPAESPIEQRPTGRIPPLLSCTAHNDPRGWACAGGGGGVHGS